MSDLAKIRIGLERQLRELSKRATNISDDLGELGDDDWSEQAIESAGDEVLEGVEESTLHEIAQIKLALKQIDAGTYGTCTKCKRPIAEGRLRTLPYATMCVKCA